MSPDTPAILLWTALGSAAFALRAGLRAKDLLPASLGAAAGWLVFRLVGGGGTGSSLALGYFVASLFIGIYAELLAAALRKPATIYVVTAIFPLVPGGGMYYTMLHSVRGEVWAGLMSGFETLSAAGAIAAGLAVSSALSRLFSLRSLARRLAARRESFPPGRDDRVDREVVGSGPAGSRDMD